MVGELLNGGVAQAFRWEASSGVTILPNLPNTVSSKATAVSADGSVIVGTAFVPRALAVRWVDGQPENLGVVPGPCAELTPPSDTSFATAVSGDGSIVAGISDYRDYLVPATHDCDYDGHGFQTDVAFRSTTVGLELLPGFPFPAHAHAFGVSLGEILAVGSGQVGVKRAPIRWTTTGPLLLRPQNGGDVGEALAVAGGAPVVVGYDSYVSPNSTFRAFRWIPGDPPEGGMHPLGILPGQANSVAQAVSFDGSVVVGGGNFGGGSKAFLWNAGDGMQDLSILLAQQGAGIAGWTLERAEGVSADGRTIVGTGKDPNGNTAAWIVVLSGVSYTALGDSYSSGEGAPRYEEATDTNGPPEDKCHRSKRAYSTMVARPGHTQSIKVEMGSAPFVACSGAQAVNILSGGIGQYNEPAQLATGLVNENTDLVTITIGGNDLGFGPLLKKCAEKGDCRNQLLFPEVSDYTTQQLMSLRLHAVESRTRKVYEGIRAAAPNATVVVLGYPNPLPLSGGCGPFFIHFSNDDLLFLREIGCALDGVLESSAAAAGVHFVHRGTGSASQAPCGDVADHFEGHDACAGRNAWMNGAKLSYPNSSYHPNAQGQKESAKLINLYLAGKTPANWPEGFFQSGLPMNPSPLSLRTATLGTETATPSIGTLTVNAVGVRPCDTRVLVPGDVVRLRGGDYGPGTSVFLSIESLNGDFTSNFASSLADAAGELDATVTIPDDIPAPGASNIRAVGVGENGQPQLLLEMVGIAPSSVDDSDSDGVPDICDNCPLVANHDQTDDDKDGAGNSCDPCPSDVDNDSDGDGLCADGDACPFDFDNDLDADGVCGDEDNCPDVFNPDQADANHDGIGNACGGAGPTASPTPGPLLTRTPSPELTATPRPTATPISPGSSSPTSTTTIAATPSPSISWVPTGPYGGGVVGALAVDPSDPAIVYAGSTSGVFKSTDAGAIWRAMNEGLRKVEHLSVSSLVVDPADTSTVYAGLNGGGVYKTTNGGASWKPENSGLGDVEHLLLHELVLDPSAPSTIYAVTSDGLCRSFDAGDHWINLNVFPYRIAIAPTTPSTVYVTTVQGVSRSTNQGDSWSAINSGLTGGAAWGLAVDPSSTSRLYAWTHDGTFVTEDGGGLWTAVSSGPTDGGPLVAVDPSNPAIVYTGDYGPLFRSDNSGKTWTVAQGGLQGLHVLSVAFDHHSPSTVYVGTEGAGMFKSTNAGEAWTSISKGFSGRSVSALTIDPTQPATVYAAGRIGGLFKSTNGGASWAEMNAIYSPESGYSLATTSITQIVVHPGSSEILYVLANGLVFQSTNGGMIWSDMPAFGYASALAIDPVNPQRIYLGSDRAVRRSSDGGLHWMTLTDGLAALNTGIITVLVIVPSDTVTVYAVVNERGVFKSVDRGEHWVPVNNGLSDLDVMSLIVDPGHPSTLYAGTLTKGLFKTTDGGATWSPLTDEVSLPAVQGLVIDPAETGTVYAGTYGAGVLATTDGGRTWMTMNTGLDDGRFVWRLALVHAPRAVLYAGTEGHGVFRAGTLSTTTSPSPTALATPIAAERDPYLCYGAKRSKGTAKFSKVVGRYIEDPFGKVVADAIGLLQLCAPADFGGLYPDALGHAPHLVGYALKSPKFAKVANQTFVSSLGVITLDVQTRGMLALPAAISLNGVPPELGTPTIEPFMCYGVKPHKGSPKPSAILGMPAKDHFATRQFDLRKPTRVCTPASLDGEPADALTEPGELLCYALKVHKGSPKLAKVAAAAAQASDRFGALTIDITKPRELCVPALRNP